MCISDDDLPATRIHMGLYRKLSATATADQSEIDQRVKLFHGLVAVEIGMLCNPTKAVPHAQIVKYYCFLYDTRVIPTF